MTLGRELPQRETLEGIASAQARIEYVKRHPVEQILDGCLSACPNRLRIRRPPTLDYRDLPVDGDSGQARPAAARTSASNEAASMSTPSADTASVLPSRSTKPSEKKPDRSRNASCPMSRTSHAGHT